LNDDSLDSIFDKAALGTSLVVKDRRTLTIDYVPDRLPFRDEESKTIAHTLSIVLKGSRPSNLLLFGKPGTGKTAVVKNVLHRLSIKGDELGIQLTVLIPHIRSYMKLLKKWVSIKEKKNYRSILQAYQWVRRPIEY
jgi:cell division control protein 6